MIRDGTSPLVGAESNLCMRNSARLLGQDQELAPRTQMQELASSTTDLKEAKVFEFAHKRLDSLMSRAATTLNEGTADAAVVTRQAASVRILQSVIDALDGRKKKGNAFRENEQGGGGGAGAADREGTVGQGSASRGRVEAPAGSAGRGHGRDERAE